MLYDYDRDTLADIPSKSAEGFGNLPALSMASGPSLSYRELDLLSLETASFLARRGIVKGDRVAIFSENRPEWGLASFGIARAGAVSVPLLVDFSAEQVRNILAHSGAKAVFTSTKLRKKLQDIGPSIEILPIENLRNGHEGEKPRSLNFVLPQVAPGDLAAIVYTSGTTGLSKGVMLTHRNYLADALSCRSIITVRPDDVVLSILPLAHAYEYTIGFLIPVMCGASIHYLDRPPSASVLLPALSRLRPSIVLSVPLVIEKVYRSGVKPGLEALALYKKKIFRPLLERLAGAKLMRSFGGRIRFFGIGGAPLDPEVEAFLQSAHFPFAIGYGLTETAPIIAASAVGKTRPKAAGPALEGAEIRIADSRPAADKPRTDVGEIQVRGPMVGPGYYRDPERTREAFTEDGFFRTGDLGFMDSSGCVFVRGRIKTVILGASGENIYPEEVEALLNRSPYVQESLVYGDESGLTALVQLKPEVLEELAACVKDGLAGAERAALKLGHAAGAAVRNAVDQAGAARRSMGEAFAAAERSAEKAIGELLERIKKETNEKLAGFSRIRKVEQHDEPFEKTPTQKIKRFLYPKKS